jgi:hypothetical protein
MIWYSIMFIQHKLNKKTLRSPAVLSMWIWTLYNNCWWPMDQWTITWFYFLPCSFPMSLMFPNDSNRVPKVPSCSLQSEWELSTFGFQNQILTRCVLLTSSMEDEYVWFGLWSGYKSENYNNIRESSLEVCQPRIA